MLADTAQRRRTCVAVPLLRVSRTSAPQKDIPATRPEHRCEDASRRPSKCGEGSDPRDKEHPTHVTMMEPHGRMRKQVRTLTSVLGFSTNLTPPEDGRTCRPMRTVEETSGATSSRLTPRALADAPTCVTVACATPSATATTGAGTAGAAAATTPMRIGRSGWTS